jgi:hypothetical protein
MTLPHESEADQNEPDLYVPTEAEWADYCQWSRPLELERRVEAMAEETARMMAAFAAYDAFYDAQGALYGNPPLDAIEAEIAYDAQLEREFEWADRRRAVNQLTDSEQAMVAAHGTV